MTSDSCEKVLTFEFSARLKLNDVLNMLMWVNVLPAERGCRLHSSQMHEFVWFGFYQLTNEVNAKHTI